METEANERTDHLIVTDQRRPSMGVSTKHTKKTDIILVFRKLSKLAPNWKATRHN